MFIMCTTKQMKIAGINNLNFLIFFLFNPGVILLIKARNYEKQKICH